MQSFFQRLSSRWFATMTPAFAPASTIQERETMRKRRLLSVILLLIFLWVTACIPLVLFANAGRTQIGLDLGASSATLLALWLNRRGSLKRAGLLFLLVDSFVMAMSMINIAVVNPISIFYIWTPLLLFPIIAGLFLSFWDLSLLALLEILFLIGFTYLERTRIIALSGDPTYPVTFLGVSCVVSLLVALLSALYAVTTNKAVIQADRAVELEQAHQALSESYTVLEETHSQLETAHATIQKQALTDGLTGLLNHRAVMDQLQKELERARRYARPFSLLFFDADRFKKVNDTHGHGAGDAVLRQIGERAASALRGGDTIGRFGGEEFVILLPEADAHEAAAVAERIRATIASGPVATSEVEGGLAVTVSIGLARYPSDGSSERELLSQADEAMYFAKRLGRNQVRTAEEAHRMSADVELMTLLQQEEQREEILREGGTPEHLRDTYISRTISSLMTVLERRNTGLSTHAYAVSDQATAIATAMGLEHQEVIRIGIAALLHDIGKVAVPDCLLEKSTVLSAHERLLLHEHAELGAQILEASPFLSDLKPAVRHHHERWDGGGYPDQLSGEDIPLAARIIAVAEAYDAMQRTYPYQAGRSPEEAMSEVQRRTGSQFDPTVVEAFSALPADRRRQWQPSLNPVG